MRGLEGKAALVTGGSSGLGEAIVYRFAEEGVSVAVGGRDADKTRAVAARAAALAREHGHESEYAVLLGDVSVVAECDRLVAETVERFGRLDILVNSAGIWIEKPTTEMSEEEYDRLMGINLKGAYFMCRAALRHMTARKSGVIVNIASDSGIHGEPNAAAYSAAKAGVVMMTRAMAIDHADEGIRVNAVCPGDVETPMLYRSGANRGADAKTALREANAESRSGRVTTPEEVAAVVAFLASDEARQITGAAIPIDGGGLA